MQGLLCYFMVSDVYLWQIVNASCGYERTGESLFSAAFHGIYRTDLNISLWLYM